MLDDVERGSPTAERKLEPTSKSLRVPGLRHLGAKLVRRDLRQVDDVMHVDLVPGDLDPGITVDGEVAQWMRRCRRRRNENGSGDENDSGEALHEDCSAPERRRFE